MITRRTLIASLSLTVIDITKAQTPLVLKAQTGEAQILPHVKTPIWGFNGEVPGPLLRVKQGEKLSVRFENTLDKSASIHWHGVRLPNAMDGAAGLTQPAVKKDESFLYEFTPPDAGTFWYHPHVHGNTSELLDRGLYGVLIVEEKSPPPVDRELVVVLDDWSLTDKGEIVESFNDKHDASHAGRIGGLLTANNASPLNLEVKRNERIRMRFVNVATSKVFWLKFQNMKPVMIAFDGQPSETITLKDEQIVFAPGQRADLIFDITHGVDEIRTISVFDGREAKPIMLLTASKEMLKREMALPPITALPDNPLPKEINLARAKRFEMVLDGGMKPGAMNHDNHWTINGTTTHDHGFKPFFKVKKGEVVLITIKNNSAFPHNIHTHGHHFRLLDGMDDGWKPYWLDSVLTLPREITRIAFIADNPGKWMLHCHMIEHQESGMMTWFEVV
jgi:FtsP/CotA-like multicopper oxidase with cupredoxin domain